MISRALVFLLMFSLFLSQAGLWAQLKVEEKQGKRLITLTTQHRPSEKLPKSPVKRRLQLVLQKVVKGTWLILVKVRIKVMLPKLSEAKYEGNYRVWLRFADGAEGEVDLEGELWGEVLEPLKKEALFSKFSLHKELGTIVWPNGADLRRNSFTKSCAVTMCSSRRQKAARLRATL